VQERYRRPEFGGAGISRTAGGGKISAVFVCFSSVTVLNDKDCGWDIANKPFKPETILISLYMFVVV